jgi:hypothetical protein
MRRRQGDAPQPRFPGGAAIRRPYFLSEIVRKKPVQVIKIDQVVARRMQHDAVRRRPCHHAQADGGIEDFKKVSSPGRCRHRSQWRCHPGQCRSEVETAYFRPKLLKFSHFPISLRDLLFWAGYIALQHLLTI